MSKQAAASQGAIAGAETPAVPAPIYLLGVTIFAISTSEFNLQYRLLLICEFRSFEKLRNGRRTTCSAMASIYSFMPTRIYTCSNGSAQLMTTGRTLSSSRRNR